jgi:tetratricopeptide (TPR) repeat protein
MVGDHGDVAEAEQCLRRALALEPNHPEANLELGCLLDAAADDPAAALPFFERAMQVAPDAEATYGYARCLAQVGRREEALQVLRHSPFSENGEVAKLRTEIDSGLWNR